MGGVAERHGDHAVHLLPAGGRPRLPPRDGRDHLWARAAGDVPAGSREHLRHPLERDRSRAHHLRRRVPSERGRAVRLQLRARRRAAAAGAFRGPRAHVPGAARRAPAAPRVRTGAEGLPHLQPAGCAARDLGHRAPALHPARAHARERGRAGLPRVPRGARISAAESRDTRARCRRRRCAGSGRVKGERRVKDERRVRSERHGFLLGIGTEELPPGALRSLEEALVAGLAAGLHKAGLAHGELAGFATPRRLAVRAKRLAARQPEQHVKRRGPPLAAAFGPGGEPTRAALAFAESCGTRVEALEQLDEGKGKFLFFIGTKPGERAIDLLPDLVREVLDALPIPRRMHWGEGTAMFVRPVHWVVMLLGSEVVPATLLDTPAGHFTRGHRFHAPRPIRIASPGSYERTLRERGRVLADLAARRERIRAEVTAAAANASGSALVTAALLDEVTALTEWPVALTGRFEERFLALPREVLISTLAHHQRYFPVEDASGRLLPAFIAVSNIESRDPAKVREGNERVVRARLADAAFFWEQDRKQPLAARAPALDAVTFQAKLGSLGRSEERRVG